MNCYTPAESAEHYALDSFFELSADPMCVADLGGHLLKTNAALTRFFGSGISSIEGNFFLALSDPQDRSGVEECFRQLQNSTVSDASFTARYTDSEGFSHWLKWVLFTASTHQNGQDALERPNAQPNRLVYGTARNVSQQFARENLLKQQNKRFEKQLSEQNEQIAIVDDRYQQLSALEKSVRADFDRAEQQARLYSNAIKNMQVGLYIWELKEDEVPNSLRLVATNPAAATLTGYDANDRIGDRIQEIFPSLIDTEIPNIYAEVARSGHEADLGEIAYEDSHISLKIFSVKAFSPAKNFVGITFENITQKKQAEEIQALQSAQLKVIYDSADVGIARLSPEGRWIQVNAYLCKMLGYTQAELLEKTFTEVTPEVDSAIDARIYQQLVSNKRSEITFKKRYLTKTGQIVWSQISVSTIRNDSDELLYFIATIQDITASREANRTLRRQKTNLERTNKALTRTMALLEQRNQELDQFAYVTSHDLRAPLRAIANLATWIEEDIGDDLPSENKEQFELLISRVHRMEGLINGLLRYSRIGRTQQDVESVNVRLLLEEVVHSLPVPEAADIHISSEMPTLTAKRIPLFQIFSNLVSNALKHAEKDDVTIRISVKDLDSHYQFSVQDNGPGIDPKFHQKIFTIFQTLKPRDQLESTGIGLSLVKKTVRAEGGEVSLDSAPGQGATFFFTWPKQPKENISNLNLI